jgi:hypothetical protein
VEHIAIAFGSLKYEMARKPGGSWGKGVTFTWSGKLPVGRRAVIITAVAKDNSVATLSAGTVTIAAAPAPTAKPAPKATPKPTPTATTGPVVPPRVGLLAAPAPTPVTDTGTIPTGAPIPFLFAWTPIPTPMPDPTDPPTTAAVSGGGVSPGGPAAGGDGTAIPTGSGVGPSRDGSNGGWGPIASMLALAGLQPPTLPGFALAPTLVTTTGAVTAVMALSLFGRRRRDDDPPDELLAAAVGNGVAVAAYDTLGRRARRRRPDPADMEALPPLAASPLPSAQRSDSDTAPAPRWRSVTIAGRAAVIRYRVVACSTRRTNCAARRSATSTRETRSSCSRSTVRTGWS